MLDRINEWLVHRVPWNWFLFWYFSVYRPIKDWLED